ncbi:MAG: ElyC/SanA/YdcF family protein [Clostridia bacterium]|nr:ElyC/SanA/YdcF family protein [Clostridia bacterium]
MEQTNRPENRKKQHFTLWHALGLLLILCTAIAIWFGIHPRYRFLSVCILALGALAAWKRNWMFWIIIAAELGFVVFLWTFPQAGYKIASIAPLALIAMLLVFRFGNKPLKIVAAILMGTALCGLLIVEIPIIKAASEQPGPDADYIVVLGAAVYGETPSITLEHRLEGALRYLEANPRTKAVVSGGQGAGEDISEAECMRRYLTEHGIAEERILSEDMSTSTRENLTFSEAVIKTDGGRTDRVVLVSSAYHLYRARRMAAAMGMQAGGFAGSDGYPIYMFGMYLREAAAVLKLWIFGA